MRKFFQVLLLELRSLWRTHTLPCLFVGVAAMVLLAPHISRGDGTAAGQRLVTVQLALGGVMAIVEVVALVVACGAFADERAAKRLSLTVTRPVALWSVWCGKFVAILLAAALAFAVAMATLFATLGGGGNCTRLIPVEMPTLAEEALSEYDRFMAAEETPAEVKKQPKRVVVQELLKRMNERYDAVRGGETMQWEFRLPAASEQVGTRLRFTTDFDLRTTITGNFALYLPGAKEPAFVASVTNLTRSVLDIPLRRLAADMPADEVPVTLKFHNTDKGTVMLRPRQDIFLLTPGDSAAANAVRAVAMQLVIVAVLVALGLFLSSALSKNVSVFSALVLVIVTMMAPAVLSEFPSEMGVSFVNRVGLAISKVVLRATYSLGNLHPVASFAASECVEWRDIWVAGMKNALAIPLVLMIVSALVLKYRPPED